jgi:hypothetical protein
MSVFLPSNQLKLEYITKEIAIMKSTNKILLLRFIQNNILSFLNYNE